MEDVVVLGFETGSYFAGDHMSREDGVDRAACRIAAGRGLVVGSLLAESAHESQPLCIFAVEGREH